MDWWCPRVFGRQVTVKGVIHPRPVNTRAAFTAKKAGFNINQPLSRESSDRRATYRVSRSSHPGRLSERRALGPPSLGDVGVHTTPTADPASATIGEPDIPPRTRSAARAIHSGPPTRRRGQEDHRPPGDSTRAGRI